MSIEKKTRTTKNFFVIDYYRSGVIVDHEYLRPHEVAERIYRKSNVYYEHIGFLNDGTAIFGQWENKNYYTLAELGETYQDLLTQ